MLYDILIYNINLSECLYYVLQFFITNNYLKHSSIFLVTDSIKDISKVFVLFGAIRILKAQESKNCASTS